MVSRKWTRQLSFGFTLPMAAAQPPSAMTVCALPNSDLEMIAVFLPLQPRLDRRAQPGAARADDHHVISEAVDIARRRQGGRPCVAGSFCVAHTTARSVN